MKTKKPSHEELVRRIRELIDSKRVGERLKTDRELAKDFGISNVTLRAAMMELQKEGLVTRRVGEGTFVADITPRQHVAIVVSQMLPFAQTMAMAVLDELNRSNVPHKLYVLPRVLGGRMCQPWPQEEHLEVSGLTAAMANNSIRGVISVGIGNKSGWADPLIKRCVPMIYSQSESAQKFSFGLNYEQPLRKAVRYLVAHKRRRIAFLSWSQTGSRAAVDLFKQEVERTGVETRPNWICNDANPMNPASGWEAFREIWSAYPDAKPDALIAKDDRLFISASSAILELGLKVPRDLQIVTHWNRDSGCFCPFPIARFEFDPALLGREVAQLMVECFSNPDTEAKAIIQKSTWFDEGDYESANAYMQLPDSISSPPYDLHHNIEL